MHEKYMREALKEAKKAKDKDEVPIGCVIVKDDKIIARAHNLRESKQQSINHAEILALQKACKKVESWRLENCTLYVTLEPCCMCAGAILQSRIACVVYGADDPKGGSIKSTLQMYEQPGFNHYPNVIDGILKEECSTILREFFKSKRIKNRQKQIL